MRTALGFASLVAIVGCAPDGIARNQPALRSGTIRERMEALSDRDREACQVKQATWFPATATPPRPAHARIVLCWSKDCGEAQYDATGRVTNISELTSIPTSGLLYIPEGVTDAQVALAFITGGSFDHTGTQFAFGSIARGLSVISMKHPDPGRSYPSGQNWGPAEKFAATHNGADYRAGYLGLAKQSHQCVLGRLFGLHPRAYLAVGQSNGVNLGVGMFERDDDFEEPDDGDFPFDGIVMLAGGNGLESWLKWDQRFQVGMEEPDPKPDCYTPIFGAPVAACLNGTYGNGSEDVALVDPAGAKYLNDNGLDVRSYQIADQPPAVRRDWRAMHFGARLKAKTVILAGLLNPFNTEWTIEHTQRVVAAGAADMKRLYFFKTLTHEQTTGRNLQGTMALIGWVVDGIEPPAIATLDGHSSTTCETRGFTNDPLACAWNEFNSP